MNDNNDKQLQQSCNTTENVNKDYVKNNIQSFYYRSNQTFKDYPHCFYENDKKMKIEENYPQNFYYHKRNK